MSPFEQMHEATHARRARLQRDRMRAVLLTVGCGVMFGLMISFGVWAVWPPTDGPPTDGPLAGMHPWHGCGAHGCR